MARQGEQEKAVDEKQHGGRERHVKEDGQNEEESGGGDEVIAERASSGG